MKGKAMSRRQLRASLALWTRKLAYRERRLRIARRDAHRDTPTHRDIVSHKEAARIHKWERLVSEAHRMIARRRTQLRAAQPMHTRALAFARTLVGIMEEGGNNVGRRVVEIIRANGGAAGEPWCGDFCAFVYRHVGSKAVTRSWASVRLLGMVLGVRRTSKPVPGDLVRYTFDHVGIFVRWIDSHTIETIEGNTGATGAVSDSATGGDGVYIKHRNVSLVRDYLHVTK
jgi:hypothetical protein